MNRTRIRRVISPFDIDNEIAEKIRESTRTMEDLQPLTEQDLMIETIAPHTLLERQIRTLHSDLFPQEIPTFYQLEEEEQPSFYQDLPYDEEQENYQETNIINDTLNSSSSISDTSLSSLAGSENSWFK